MGVRTDRGSKFLLGAVLQGVLLSLICILAVSLLLGIIMTVSGWDLMPRAVLAVHYVIGILGGFVAGRRSKRVGWLHGAAVGLLYTGIVAVVFAAGEPEIALLRPDTVSHIGWGVLSGTFGGVVGVSGNG